MIYPFMSLNDPTELIYSDAYFKNTIETLPEEGNAHLSFPLPCQGFHRDHIENYCSSAEFRTNNIYNRSNSYIVISILPKDGNVSWVL